MSIHRFRTDCDICGKKSAEYQAFPVCTECGRDICATHWVNDTHDPETNRVLCLECFSGGSR